ncbi:MAG TPA: sigma 54-interacting transcriptional regulator [Syntrophomonas sp.]|nr:sigma 54-interacting transcriptional regulator [Syntrophomonas sp.]
MMWQKGRSCMQSLKKIHTYKVIEAWRLFAEQNIIMEGVLRPEVERSWRRSKDLGLSPWVAPPLSSVPDDEMELIKQELADLIAFSQPIMNYVYATNSSFYLDNQVCLISKAGVIISEVNKNTQFSTVSVGKYLDEEHVGTCPGGLILKEKIPYVLGGYENYINYYQTIFGGGSPIFDSSEELIGILGLFNPYGKIPEQPLQLMINAAHLIEEFLNNDRFTLKETDDPFTSFLDEINYAALLCNNEGYIVNANNQCAEMFNMSVRNFTGKNYQELAMDLSRLLNTKTENENFELKLNGYPIPCILNNCSNVQGINGQNYSLLLFSEDINKRVAKKIVNVPVDSNRFNFSDIVGTSIPFRNVMRIASRAAQVTAPVLIEGESGSGKEVFAHAIHNASQRTGPFIAINCGAIQTSLLQSELFDMKRVLLPEPSKAVRRVSSNRLKGEPCFSTSWARCPWICKSICCGYCRTRRLPV